MQKRNIQLLAFAALLLVAAGCKGKKKPSDEAKNVAPKTEETQPVPVTESTGFTDHALMFLLEEEGTYPKQSGLLQNEELKSRLEVLLGSEADSLLTFWNVETPVQVAENTIFTSGCQQHNCPAHQYVLVVDLFQNSINVYAFRHDVLYVYVEQDVLPLPATLNQQLETVKKNAGVTPKSTQTIRL